MIDTRLASRSYLPLPVQSFSQSVKFLKHIPDMNEFFRSSFFDFLALRAETMLDCTVRYRN